MSSGTLKLSLEEIEKKVSYPPRDKKQQKLEQHTSPESKKLLRDYMAQTKPKKTESSRFKMSSINVATTGATKDSATTIAMFMEDGNAALEKGNTQEALSYYLESVRLGNNTAELYNTIADLYQGKLMYAEAIDFYTRSITVNPLRCEMYLRRGDCYLSMNNYEASIQEYIKYMRLEVPPQEVLIRACKVALDAERIDIGDALLENALQRVPDDAYVHYLKGDVEERKGNIDISRQYFERVTKLDPSFPTPYVEQAEKHFADGDYVLALNVFQAVLKLMPAEASVYARLADVYEVLGAEYASNRLACLSSALEFGLSDDAQQLCYVRRAVLHRENGHIAEAISDLSLCLTANPKHDEARELRAEAFLARNAEGDITAACEDYSQLVAMTNVTSKRKARPYAFLAEQSFSRGEYAKASTFYAFAIFCGYPEDSFEVFKLAAACSRAFLQMSDSTLWYEPRPIAEDAKVKDAKKTLSVTVPPPPLQFRILDGIYVKLKEEEPTVHTDVELEFVSGWTVYHDTVVRRLDEIEEMKSGGKKKPGPKK